MLPLRLDYHRINIIVGYIGTDFFSYRMTVGSILTAPVTIAINIDDPSNPQAGENNANKKDKKANKRKTQTDYDIEQGSAVAGKTSNRSKNEVEIEMVEIEESKQSPQRKSMASSGASTGGLFSSMTKKSNSRNDDQDEV